MLVYQRVRHFHFYGSFKRSGGWSTNSGWKKNFGLSSSKETRQWNITPSRGRSSTWGNSMFGFSTVQNTLEWCWICVSSRSISFFHHLWKNMPKAAKLVCPTKWYPTISQGLSPFSILKLLWNLLVNLPFHLQAVTGDGGGTPPRWNHGMSCWFASNGNRIFRLLCLRKSKSS